MGRKLPEIGVRAVAADTAKYFKSLNDIEKNTTKTAKTIESVSGKTSAFSAAFSQISAKIGGFSGEIGETVNKITSARASLTDFFGQFPAGAANIALAGAAAAAAATAFVALGVRGSTLTGIGDSFDRLTRSIGIDAIPLLTQLRAAAKGTVTDFKLLEQANIALSGATGEFGRQFGTALPQLLRIAQAQSNATGQSIEYLYESIVTGVKRASPLLIDNTGLTLNVTEANQRYAQSIGVAVSQLTAEQKQIALLNAVLAAGEGAIAAFGDQQETGADKMARFSATINNIIDRFAIGVQPAFTQFLDVINRVLSFIEILTTAINPLLSSFLELASTLVTAPLQAILSIIEPIVRLTGFLITLATVIVQPVIRAFNYLVQFIGRFVEGIIKFMGELVNNNLGLNFDNLALNLGRGAGFAFSAFANGIIAAANALIFPAVIQIATFIADFLIGQSPPPRGPLSKIDEGGANLMSAFLDGMLGVALQPVQEVAANVEAILGGIGKLSLAQVEARIAQLDKALQPFSNQLEIVKSNFEAISEPAQAALNSIDRQLNKALEALSIGSAGSAEAVRALDNQRSKIEAAVDAQQSLVDEAQIQFTLAKAQQVQERTLLGIRQQQLKATQGITQAAGAAAKEPKEEKQKAGKADAPLDEAIGGGVGGAMSDFPSVLDLIGGQAAVDQMSSDLSQGFQEGLVAGIDTSALATLQGNQGALSEQLNRIAGANPVAAITDKLAGIGQAFQDNVVAPLTQKVNEISAVLANFFSGTEEGSIKSRIDSAVAFFSEFPDRISLALSSIGGILTISLVEPVTASINEIKTTVENFFIGEGEGTLKGALDTGVAWFRELPARIGEAVATIGNVFLASFVIPIVGAMNAVVQAIEEALNGALVGLRELIAGLRGFFELTNQLDFYNNLQNQLGAGVHLDRIAVPTLGARTGGVFGPGALRVHRDEQLVTTPAASRLSVFPANVTRSLDVLSKVFAQPMPMELPNAGNVSNNSTTNIDRSINPTFNGVERPQDQMLRLAILRASR